MQSNQITKQVTLSAGRISGNNKLTVELKDECVIVKEKASRTVDSNNWGWGGGLQVPFGPRQNHGCVWNPVCSESQSAAKR